MTRMQGLSMAQARTLLPDGVKQFLRDNLIRFGGALMLAAAGFVALALVSHSSSDPSWNNIVNTPATNRAGFVGAYIADFLWQWLGILSIMIPSCLAVWGLRIVWELRLPLWRWRPLGLLCGLPSGTLALSAVPAPARPAIREDIVSSFQSRKR